MNVGAGAEGCGAAGGYPYCCPTSGPSSGGPDERGGANGGAVFEYCNALRAAFAA